MRLLTLVALALVLAAPAAAAKPSAPKAGDYTGTTEGVRDLTLNLDGDQVVIAAFAFACDGTVGHTSLQSIPIEKRKGRYRIDIAAHSVIGFDDARPDENTALTIKGTFSRSGERAGGRLLVRSSTCKTGRQKWVAHRRSAE
jgi:hypothetical protein